MLKACLTHDIDTLPYRLAATLLLLYAQSVLNIAAMKTTDLMITPDSLRLSGRRGSGTRPGTPHLATHRSLGLAPQHAHRQQFRQREAFTGYRAGKT
jgi:hypothetical protein